MHSGGLVFKMSRWSPVGVDDHAEYRIVSCFDEEVLVLLAAERVGVGRQAVGLA